MNFRKNNIQKEAVMKRVGQVIKVKPEYLEKYKALHANPWPEVNEMIKKCNIQIILFTIAVDICSVILSMLGITTKRT